ncbi:MarR family transcriptional regulator [Microbacterium saccharophilum]|uniref:MarR family transcriptional regulator n=1 Tax=Microbacterium saccharophilum TaxID=1213358 RepID=A0A5C8I8D5_9MICO|nr:MarR family transcriptional regulator [Microbacterium saccharophilum]TXK14095.1 MarR family transcriptional regulator [Microbacterium saccharophilum]GEP46641.1 MarR family transcriptional regulator [Microbacterium saccharophilum]
MTRSEDVLHLMLGAHALTRMAALDTRSETPAAQWRTLSLLRDHGPQRLGDLARRSRISQPGMTRLAGQLAEAGLLERSADPADSRATVLSATPAGLAALEAWLEELGAALTPRFGDLSDEDWEILRRAAAILARKTATPEESR